MEIVKDESFVIPLEGLLSNAKALHMNWINPGTFTMGSPKDEPGRSSTEDQFTLILSHGFWLGRYPVTQTQWEAVVGSNPSHYHNNPNYPVENIDWTQATLFSETLNKRFKRVLPVGYNFGLPTEAQWEFACRAGTQSRFFNGDDPNLLSKIAWYSENSDGHPHPVGEKRPNRWGLYDMLGNVFEWCYDSTSEYPKRLAQDWFGESSHRTRSLRGGSYGQSSIGGVSCASRGYWRKNLKRQHIGFRLCLRSLHPGTIASDGG
ncbi:MAG: formylglycine-generating enzyme family protein [Chloroflexi bacterium]|nr:formylglycine-generating enzyme family protein [Chloroflexota bacterium]